MLLKTVFPLLALVASLAAGAAATTEDSYYITDEEYYSMPQLFYLDEYEGCMAGRGVYCVGSFHLTSHSTHRTLYQMMQRYSANWVDHYNHTRLHRGLCISARCPRGAISNLDQSSMISWFESCVNATTTETYNLTATLYQLEYCRRGPDTDEPPLSNNQRVFVGFCATLLALATLCTVLDLVLPDHAKKGASWALSWSIRGCWNTLTSKPPNSAETDLRSFDGLRSLCMLSVIVEHVVWLSTLSYVAAPRYSELTRRDGDVMLMTNSTLLVQIFFMMSSYLLAHKLLQQRRRRQRVPPLQTFLSTMINRIMRVSPTYFVVVWFAASWWGHAGRGPLWEPLVGSEVAVCQRKWWTHLLYLNNVIYADDKCLIQTWYLAADMQLYALGLLLTLVLLRWRRGAVYLLTALLVASVALLFCLAYYWSLVPTFVMHRPELIRTAYSGEPSFNVLYQSPLGNVPGALAGLLLAHLHHHLLDSDVRLAEYTWFRWLSVMATPLGFWWITSSPRLLGPGPPSRLAAAALAALERPLFAIIVGLALLGAMHDIHSPWRRWMSWSGWTMSARLSFGALLLHMPLNKTLVASRLHPTQLDRLSAILEWFGVASVSYLAAMPLALLVEIPFQRLHKALTTPLDIVPAARSPQEQPVLEENNNTQSHKKTNT